LIQQIFSYKAEQNKSFKKAIFDFNKDFIQEIVDIFLKYKEMDYLYLEIFNLKIDQEINKKRNYLLENKICMGILSKLNSQIGVLYLSEEDKSMEEFKETIIKIIKIFFNSPILRYQYVNNYKNKLTGGLFVEFMNKYINI
jgi:hypothetical protein